MRPSARVIAATLTVGALLAPSAVAHADQTARETIAQLEGEGYTVNIDRIGSAGIDQCVVTSVRNPQTHTRLIREYYGKRDENGDRKYRIVEIVTSRSISVSLACGA